MRKNSIKNIRINEEVMRELSNIIRGEIKDPRINPMTSVVAVEVAPDLKTAKAYISVLGDKKSQADTLAGLTQNSRKEHQFEKHTGYYIYHRPVYRVWC